MKKNKLHLIINSIFIITYIVLLLTLKMGMISITETEKTIDLHYWILENQNESHENINMDLSVKISLDIYKKLYPIIDIIYYKILEPMYWAIIFILMFMIIRAINIVFIKTNKFNNKIKIFKIVNMLNLIMVFIFIFCSTYTGKIEERIIILMNKHWNNSYLLEFEFNKLIYSPYYRIMSNQIIINLLYVIIALFILFNLYALILNIYIVIRDNMINKIRISEIIKKYVQNELFGMTIYISISIAMLIILSGIYTLIAVIILNIIIWGLLRQTRRKNDLNKSNLLYTKNVASSFSLIRTPKLGNSKSNIIKPILFLLISSLIAFITYALMKNIDQ